MKLYFEPQSLFSNADDTLIDVVKQGMNEDDFNRLSKSVENATDEEYSNFQLFGIGKPSQKQLERREQRAVRKVASKEEFKNLPLLKKALVATQKINPAAAIPRAGVLAGARVNVFGMSVRLYPAFLTPEQAKAQKIRVDAIEPAKKAWEKVSKFWIFLGGSTPALKQAIMNGYNKPVFKWTKSARKREALKSTFTGEESWMYDQDVYSGAYDGGASVYISAGISLIGAIMGMIAKSGAKKNPYEEGVNPALEGQISDAEKGIPPVDEKDIKDVEDAAADEKKRGVPPDEGAALDDKILGIPKTGFYIGLGVIGLAAIGLTIYLVKRKK